MADLSESISVKDQFFSYPLSGFKIHPKQFDANSAKAFFEDLISKDFDLERVFARPSSELKLYFQQVSSTRYFLEYPIFMEIIDASLQLSFSQKKQFLRAIKEQSFLDEPGTMMDEAEDQFLSVLQKKDQVKIILGAMLRFPGHLNQLQKLLANPEFNRGDFDSELTSYLHQKSLTLLNLDSKYADVKRQAAFKSFQRQFSHFLLLALGDASRWEVFIPELNKDAPDFFMAGIFVDVFKTLPEEQQAHLLQKLGQARLKASELYKVMIENDLPKPFSKANNKTDAKRLLDYFFLLVTRGDLLVNQLIEDAHLSAKEAFVAYIDMVRNYYPSRFSSEQLLAILFEIADYLNQHPETVLSIKSIGLGGSLFTGKASLNPNDFDMVLMEHLSQTGNKAHVEAITKIVSKNLGLAKITVDGHQNPQFDLTYAWTMLQGVAFQLRPDQNNHWQVDMLVGLPGSHTLNLERTLDTEEEYARNLRRYPLSR